MASLQTISYPVARTTRSGIAYGARTASKKRKRASTDSESSEYSTDAAEDSMDIEEEDNERDTEVFLNLPARPLVAQALQRWQIHLAHAILAARASLASPPPPPPPPTPASTPTSSTSQSTMTPLALHTIRIHRYTPRYHSPLAQSHLPPLSPRLSISPYSLRSRSSLSSPEGLTPAAALAPSITACLVDSLSSLESSYESLASQMRHAALALGLGADPDPSGSAEADFAAGYEEEEAEEEEARGQTHPVDREAVRGWNCSSYRTRSPRGLSPTTRKGHTFQEGGAAAAGRDDRAGSAGGGFGLEQTGAQTSPQTGPQTHRQMRLARQAKRSQLRKKRREMPLSKAARDGASVVAEADGAQDRETAAGKAADEAGREPPFGAYFLDAQAREQEQESGGLKEQERGQLEGELEVYRASLLGVAVVIEDGRRIVGLFCGEGGEGGETGEMGVESVVEMGEEALGRVRGLLE